MSRVIVDALDSNGPNPPPSAYLNMTEIRAKAAERSVADRSPPRSPGEPSSVARMGRKSPPIHAPVTMNGESPPHAHQGNNHHVMMNGVSGPPHSSPPHSHSPSELLSKSVSSLTAESLLNAESQIPIGSATAAIASAKAASSSSSSNPHSIVTSGIVSMTPGISSSVSHSHPIDEDDDDEEKPLNLSASKVLKASNQMIIDHFIDKLLTTGGKCGEGKLEC